jgi:hypothetical protein
VKCPPDVGLSVPLECEAELSQQSLGGEPERSSRQGGFAHRPELWVLTAVYIAGFWLLHTTWALAIWT